LAGFYPETALFPLRLHLHAVVVNVDCSGAAARCDNRSLVASELWFLGTCRRLPEILPAGPSDEPSSARDHAEPAPGVGTGSSADARPASQLLLRKGSMPNPFAPIPEKDLLRRMVNAYLYSDDENTRNSLVARLPPMRLSYTTALRVIRKVFEAYDKPLLLYVAIVSAISYSCLWAR
jgi:hypothetical protein